MFDGSKHRKLVKHYPTPGVCHELTWSCYGQRFLLCTPDRRDLVQQAIQRSTIRYGFATLAFVIMSNHVHLLVEIWQKPMTELLQNWKGFTARRINRVLGRRAAHRGTYLH